MSGLKSGYSDEKDGYGGLGAGSEKEEEVVAVNITELDTIKGELQPPAFRDWQFSVLFWIQVAAIAGTAMTLAPAMFASGSGGASDGSSDSNRVYNDDFAADSSSSNNNNNNSNGMFSTWNITLFLVGSFIAGSLVVMSAFRIMVRYPLESIQVSFFVAPVTFGVVAMLLWMAGGDSEDNVIYIIFWVLAALFSCISLCCYMCYKRFMPYAAVNLKVALTAVRVNIGLFFLSLTALVVIYAWSILWILAFAGVLHHDQQKPQVSCQQQDPNGNYSQGQMCDQQPSAFAITMLLLCLYWTQQVIQNTVHTTTAGTVSSWWISSTQLEPEDEIVSGSRTGSNCCGPDVAGALYRSCTYSFGSICFGSLLVAILQTLEQMARNRRGDRDLLSLVLQCIIACLRAWLEYFNSWAFCYVGIYGYDYLTAGRKVIELFKARGWTTLITDRLVFRVLLLAHLGVAAVTGALSALLMLSSGQFANRQDRADAAAIGFWIGFFVGLMISSIVLFVVESAVRTIMVCFAEQPGEGPQHLLQELKETYAATYPDVFVFTRVETMELHEQRNVV